MRIDEIEPKKNVNEGAMADLGEEFGDLWIGIKKFIKKTYTTTKIKMKSPEEREKVLTQFVDAYKKQYKMYPNASMCADALGLDRAEIRNIAEKSDVLELKSAPKLTRVNGGAIVRFANDPQNSVTDKKSDEFLMHMFGDKK